MIVAKPEDPTLDPGVVDVLAALRQMGVVLDSSDAVVVASDAAVRHGLVRDGELVHQELRDLVREARRGGDLRDLTLDLPRGPLLRGRMLVSARASLLRTGHVLLLADDRTRVSRVDEVRRDFVANVSHELKTPVGGLSLLAEAVMDASGDPDAVIRFAGRMRVEADRLARLVQEIVDLSRLQVADTLTDPKPVDLADAAREAVDRCRLLADSKSTTIDLRTERAVVYGDLALLTTAIRNLVDNAVNYSDPQARVVVTVRRIGAVAEVVVSDNGLGISPTAQSRVFERFFRLDPARSRATGGTGLGLSIVKHVCANHGGDVRLWSEPGQGSTFTISLPVLADDDPVLTQLDRKAPR